MNIDTLRGLLSGERGSKEVMVDKGSRVGVVNRLRSFSNNVTLCSDLEHSADPFLPLVPGSKFSNPTQTKITGTTMDVLEMISAEVQKARTQFPEGRFLFAALMEEVGEAAQSLLEVSQGGKKKDGTPFTDIDVLKELVQIGAMAVRLIEEADRAFTYRYPFNPKETA